MPKQKTLIKLYLGGLGNGINKPKQKALIKLYLSALGNGIAVALQSTKNSITPVSAKFFTFLNVFCSLRLTPNLFKYDFFQFLGDSFWFLVKLLEKLILGLAIPDFDAFV